MIGLNSRRLGTCNDTATDDMEPLDAEFPTPCHILRSMISYNEVVNCDKKELDPDSRRHFIAVPLCLAVPSVGDAPTLGSSGSECDGRSFVNRSIISIPFVVIAARFCGL